MPPIFFSGVLPLLDVTHCCKLSLYVISRKTNKSNLRKWQKTQFQARFWLIYSILRKLSNAADRREPLSVCLPLSLSMMWKGSEQETPFPVSVSLRTKDQKNVLQTTIYIWNKRPNKTTLMSDQSTQNCWKIQQLLSLQPSFTDKKNLFFRATILLSHKENGWINFKNLVIIGN